MATTSELTPSLLPDSDQYKSRGYLHAKTTCGKICNTLFRAVQAKLCAPTAAERGFILRTPDSCFEGLDGWNHEPKYVMAPLSALTDALPEYTPAMADHNALKGAPVRDVRLHYIDVRPDGVACRGTVLCVHGEPTWAYLYRKMITTFVAAGYRVVCLDQIGFGRSDKFGSIRDYTHAMHVSTLEWFIGELGLTNLTLVCQDWGVPTAVSVLRRQPERFGRVVLMNGSVGKGKVALSAVVNFLEWRMYAARMGTKLDVELVMGEGSPLITHEELRAYSAPFPSTEFKAGAAAWPLLAPLTPKFAAFEEMELSREWLSRCMKPTLLVFSEHGTCQALADLVPGCTTPPVVMPGAGHFLQEPAGVAIAQHVVSFIEAPAKDTAVLSKHADCPTLSTEA